MSDTALPEPMALPHLSDAPPSSSGHESAHSRPVDQAIPDELKVRLDTITHSEVSRHERVQLGISAVSSPRKVRADEDRVARRSESPPSLLG